MADTSLNENRIGLLIWQTSNLWQSKLRKELSKYKISFNRAMLLIKEIMKEMTINNSKTFAIFVGLLVFVSCSNAPNEADLILSSNNVILMNADKDAAPLSIAIADKKIIWINFGLSI